MLMPIISKRGCAYFDTASYYEKYLIDIILHPTSLLPYGRKTCSVVVPSS